MILFFHFSKTIPRRYTGSLTYTLYALCSLNIVASLKIRLTYVVWCVYAYVYPNIEMSNSFDF